MNFVLKMMDFRYASAWFGVLRKDLNGRLASWKHIGRAKGVARPELRGWIDDVFGQEWNRIKKMKMPSSRSGAAVTKPGMRNKNRGKR